MPDLPSLSEWCRDAHNEEGRVVRQSSGRLEYICASDAPLAQRLDLLHVSHPTSICRRDRVAIMAALEAIDVLREQVAALQAEVTQLEAKAAGVALPQVHLTLTPHLARELADQLEDSSCQHRNAAEQFQRPDGWDLRRADALDEIRAQLAAQGFGDDDGE